MAPKTSSIRDNPPSASSSSSSGSTAEASGSSEYESTDDEPTKPNGASSTLTPTPKKTQSGSKLGDESGDDSAETNGKPDDSSRKASSSHATKPSKPAASSTESDSESTDDEAAKSSSKLSSKKPPAPAPKKKPQPVEEDSGSDSETESSEGKRDLKPGSAPSKSLSQQQKAPAASGKREAEKSPDQKSSKRAKKKEGDEKKPALISSHDSEKKIPFQRTFTDSDEIEILKGIAEFEGKKKGNVVQDSNGLYEFIKTRIETKFTKAQLLKKLQSMKRRFPGLANRVNKGLKNLKPLDHTLYELSNKLWGPGGCLEKTEKELTAENATPIRKLLPASSKLAKKTVMVPAVEVMKSVVSSWYVSENLGVCNKGGVDAEYMREVMESVDEEEKAELEGRWRKNQGDMARVVEERLRIAQQLCKLVDKHSSSSTS